MSVCDRIVSARRINLNQREYNLIMWLRAQMQDFQSPPGRWSAQISCEGTRITGSLSKNHRVEIDGSGGVTVDGQPSYVDMT